MVNKGPQEGKPRHPTASALAEFKENKDKEEILLKISATQMHILQDVTKKQFIHRTLAHLRQNLPAHFQIPDDELEHSITEWLQDAMILGLTADTQLTKYIESCAITQGKKEPLEARIAAYLHINHSHLLSKLDDVDAFVKTALELATKNDIKQDEGVAWLTVILLAGHHCTAKDDQWLRKILASTWIDEEIRMHMVHHGAIERGWISEDRATRHEPAGTGSNRGDQL